ncbi:MAG: glycosyl hydrolase family 79 C-terminal domain-containing protein [Myxococcota bacterium]|nr:glycosyl hydrolase family 79 C-terminal domain-containing protein [Myxococcota bacterium]
MAQDAPSDGSTASNDSGRTPSYDAGPPTGPLPYTGPKVTGTVKVNRASPMGSLAPGYAGFSFEKSHMTDGFFTGTHAPLIEMFKLLGPGYVRLGGHDVDSRHWQASAPPVPGGTTSQMVGTADVDGLAAFLRATGWKVIYGLNLQSETTPTNDVAEATYVANALGANLHSFEIGNEWGGGLEARWRTFADAIKAALPATQQTGPGACCGTGFPVSFAANEASRLVLLTYHHYVGVAGQGASVAAVLNPDNGLIADTKQLVAAASSNSISGGFRWGEINTYAHHGQAGVSDAYASALWGIDNMLTSAELGAVGVNYHGGGQNMDGNNCPSGPSSCGAPFRYSPIVEINSQVTAAAPLFYAMLFVSHAGTGAMFSTTLAVPNNLNVTAYAVGQTDGSTVVVIVNKDSANGFEATVDVGAAVTSATGDYLEGPALSATSGVKFAGAGVSATGAWTPQPPHGLPIAGNTFTVVVPPIGAVLVHAR